MNIFHKVTLESMKKSRARTVVTVIGVALSAAMVTAVATFAVSLLRYMVDGAIEKYGGWHVAFLDAPASFVQQRMRDEEAAGAAAFENIGYAVLEGGKNPNKPYLFLAGFGEEAFGALPIRLVSGRLPQNNGEILVPAHVAANGGVRLAVGDTLSLDIGNRVGEGGKLSQHDPYLPGEREETLVLKSEKHYTVVGICERPAFEEYSAPGYTLITTLGPASDADSWSVFVTLKNPRHVHAYAGGMAGGGACVFNDEVLRFMGLSNDTLFNTLLFSVGAVLVALVVLGSVFLIYNAFTISLNERTRQFGILSSVGATARQLCHSVLFEGLCIGAIGIPAGMLVGIGGVGLILSFVSGNFGSILYSGVPLRLRLNLPALAAAAAISLFTILLSAYIPARKAANTPVMESIRQTGEIKVEAKAVKTSRFWQRVYGLEGTLARKNFKRNKRRYRSIVLSLTLSVVLFVSGNAFAAHLRQAAAQAVVDTDYDIVFTTRGMDESRLFGLYEALQAADGVYESSYQAMMAYSCAAKTGDFNNPFREYAGNAKTQDTVELPMDIQFIEDGIYLDFIEGLGLPAEEYTGPNAKIIAVAKYKPGTKEGQGLWDIFASGALDTRIAPITEDGPALNQGQGRSITFVDTFPLDTLPREPAEVKPYVFMAVVPYSLKGAFEAPGAPVDLGLTFLSKNPAQSAAEMEAAIQGAGIDADYTLYNVHKMMEQNRNIIFIVTVFTCVFVVMISLIAVANVFNTISTNIKLRRRELCMLRSVGMSGRDFQKMMYFECAFYGLRTLLLGLPLAAIASWLIYKGLTLGGAETGYIFPWGSMLLSVLGVFLVVFVTMLYAVGQIKKENIIDALRDDMT